MPIGAVISLIKYESFFTLQENSNYYFRYFLHSLNSGKLHHFTINKGKLVQIGHSSDAQSIIMDRNQI